MILSNHKNTNEIVLVENDVVLKRSKDGLSKKVLKESFFYKALSKDDFKDVANYFPKFYGYRVLNNGCNEIEIEFLKECISVEKVLLDSGCELFLDKKTTEGLYNLLHGFSNANKSHNFEKSKRLFNDLFIRRVLSRFKEMNLDEKLNSLNKSEKIVINGIEYKSLERSYTELIKNKLFLNILLKDQTVSFFHGDFHYENILLKDDLSIKLVDPNGLTQGLISYDFGKLLHSSFAKYSVIQNNLFTVTESKNGFSLSLQEPLRHKEFSEGLNSFLKEKLSSLEYVQALFACWCHMISLIPHHIPNGNDQMIAFYLMAVEIGEHFAMVLDTYSTWETLESKVIFDNSRMKIIEDRVVLPNGKTSYYTIWDTHKAVAIFAFNNKNQLLLKREYRHPVKKAIYDLPGGAVEDNEDVIVAAKRELEEEVGYTSVDMDIIGSFYMDPGRSNREIFIVVAKNIRVFHRDSFKENDEFIDFEFFPIKWVEKNIKSGNIRDASLLAGMAYLKLGHV